MYVYVFMKSYRFSLLGSSHPFGDSDWREALMASGPGRASEAGGRNQLVLPSWDSQGVWTRAVTKAGALGQPGPGQDVECEKQESPQKESDS